MAKQGNKREEQTNQKTRNDAPAAQDTHGKGQQTQQRGSRKP